jgi:hypothetical protein
MKLMSKNKKGEGFFKIRVCRKNTWMYGEITVRLV